MRDTMCKPYLKNLVIDVRIQELVLTAVLVVTHQLRDTCQSRDHTEPKDSHREGGGSLYSRDSRTRLGRKRVHKGSSGPAGSPIPVVQMRLINE